MRKILAIVVALGFAAPLQAENLALVIVNQEHQSVADARGVSVASGAVDVLENMGFHVLSGEGLSAEEMRAQLAGLHDRIDRDGVERLVIILAGHFVQSRSGAWLIGTESTESGLALADGQGLRLDVVFEIAAMANDSALVWLAVSPNAPDLGIGLEPGLPTRLMVPQGVGVVRGRADQIMAGLRATLRPGTALASVVDRNRNLTGEGTIPALVPFLPEGFAPGARADLRAFENAREADTEEAYRAYLEAFPNGQNAQAARAAIERLRNAPERVEERLQLTRDERRAIQRDLTILGYDTRGVDGIFGPGTRGSIGLWQQQNDLPETGYLTRDQIFRLARQAADRAAQIEAEERAQREAAERTDREFWAATGAAGDEPGLRRYLQRYPDGIFAGLARDRLEAIAEAARQAELARDLAAWRQARQTDTVQSYRAYLREWPEGEFAADAQQRIADLRPDPPRPPEPPLVPENPQALAAEQALRLSQPTRLLIEQRLARLGLDPGPIDGSFDDQTRIAIRQAQERFDLRPTGYVNQDLLTMLISDLFRDFFR